MSLPPTKTLAVLLTALLLLTAAPSADEKHLSVYSSVATYTLPVVDRTGKEYVGLLELLEPFGRVNSRMEGQHWKFRFNEIETDFVAGRSRARMRGKEFELPAPFLIENSRGLVPVSSLSALLPRFLGTPVNFHESARRLFIGDVATHVTAQIENTNPARLALNFSSPVNPTISTEPGKLRMVFSRDPVVAPGNQTLIFDNKTITQANYSEANGAADLTISAAAPLMASFTNNGRTITIAALAQSTPAATETAPAPGATPPVLTQTPSVTAPQFPAMTSPPLLAANGHRFIVIVDPAHGGDERGAALTDRLAEKDVTLGFGRLLRHELDVRGISVLLLRDGDATLTLDQRAGTANAAHGAVYVTLHAASSGNGARIYTALLPIEGPISGVFHPWNSAQAPSLAVSQSIASEIIGEMQKQQMPARAAVASLRPLNNLLMPAVAVELAPGPNGTADLSSANYQQKAAAAIADAIAAKRSSLAVQP